MHLQSLYKNNPFVTVNGLQDKNDVDNSVSSNCFERGVCLPSDIKMTDREQDFVIEIIKNCFE